MRASIRFFRTALSAALLLACLALPAAPLAAQTPPDAAAQAEFDRGTVALNAGKYQEAVLAFDSSYRMKQVPVVLYNLGLAYNGLGQPTKALEAFEAYVKYADPAKEGGTIQAVNAEIERIKTNAARFSLKVSPETASIKIDGAAATMKDSEIWMLPGRHTIDIRAPGYETYNQPLDVQSGRYTLEINLRQSTLPPAEHAAALVDEGMLLASGANYSAAMIKYMDAHVVFPTPRGYAQMGLAEEALGQLGAAETHINEALKAKKDKWVRKNRAMLRKAQKRIMQQTKNMAKLDVGGPFPGARVSVNDQDHGTLPLAGLIYVTEGHIVLRAKLDGYQDFVLEADMPKRSEKRVVVQMEASPMPVAPLPPPPPPPPPPVVAEAPPPPPPAEEPLPKTPVEEPMPEEPGDAVSQADIEPGEEPPLQQPLATGFELMLNGGYSMWLGDNGPAGSSGGPALSLALGARIPWFLSFGLELIQGSVDMGKKGTKVIAAVNPGLYVRGHIQKHKRQFAFDVWGGAGLQPVAMSVTVFDNKAASAAQIAQSGGSQAAIQDQIARNQTGVGDVVTLQSVNVPLQLGATFFLTKGMGLDLSMALTFWMPQQLCYHDDKDQFCVDKGLQAQKTFFIGGGITFLP